MTQLSAEQVKALQRALTPRINKYIPFSPTPKQRALMLMNNVKEVLFGGAAGGGKSVAQLMCALQYVDVPGYAAILFRKTFADLTLPGALISMSKEWLMDHPGVRWVEKEHKWIFPNGATLSFGYLETDNDCYRYQGAEFQYIGIDECTHISPSNYRYMFSRLRKPIKLKVPLRFRATCNPGGQYGEYYYERFIKEAKQGERVFIQSLLHDNPYLDEEEYSQALAELDPVTRAQLLEGNWTIKAAGNMFKRQWFPIIAPAEIPVNAPAVRFWDLAATEKSTKKKGPDWTVGVKLRYHQGLYFWEDTKRVRATPKKVEDLVARTAQEDGYGCAIRMEQEPGSSGIALVEHYSRNVVPFYDFKGIKSTGSKIERAKPMSSAAENGRILISSNVGFLQETFDELEAFPESSHDDIVDGLSGAGAYFKDGILLGVPAGIAKSNGSYWMSNGLVPTVKQSYWRGC